MSQFQPRDIFVERLHQSLIGPGGDLFELPNGEEVANYLIKNAENRAKGLARIVDTEEILGTLPLKVYSSAILFPEVKKDQKRGVSEILENSGMDASDDDTAHIDHTEAWEQLSDVQEEIENSSYKEENAQKDPNEGNTYFPNNFGLTFCVAPHVKTIKITVSMGLYEDIAKKWIERKVKISKHDFDALQNNPHFPFKDVIWYEGDEQVGYMLLSTKSDITSKELRERLAPFKKGEHDKSPIGLERFELLISARAYKRRPLEKMLELSVQNSSFDIFNNEKDSIIAKGFLKVYEYRGQRYVKVVIKNTFAPHPKNQFSFGKEALNEKTFFQIGIKVEADLLPYRNYLGNNEYDDEAQLIDFQYQNAKNFGIGHGCAVEWDKTENPTWIATTYMPEVEIPSVTNKFREETTHLEPVARLRNLSVWSAWSKAKVLAQLRAFVDSYKVWIESQEQEALQYAESKKITNEIIQKQRENLARLYRNIDLLENNEAVFQCFQLANTAMLIQMIISTDDRFSKIEKEWSEIEVYLNEDKNLSYKSLDFFKVYSDTIAYRPFQLAFLLLNLESTVNTDSVDRREVVDLIWFPTGGGKTEAYLVLTAFTILWRRLQNPDNYEGVSVIMRYTLRLLTAQQFERAGRLIAALEFLRRRQHELTLNLGELPITIGMWVGMSSTPNSLDEAKKKLGVGSDEEKTIDKQVRKLNKELEKGNNILNADRAYQYNVFQISACPWCGCKLITKKNNIFTHGFRVSGRFKIECINNNCDFSEYSEYNKSKKETQCIPVDVVDDSLYAHPPTLLFATVDKFAQLAHVEHGHHFFNSLSEKGLPPDLIIQDELHLLNGPLGSIVGLYEMIIEHLCTKGNHIPKIIASTATTRNTDYQIKSLYGGRDVNIFPPQGLSASDNFFSKTEKHSLRKHVGIMPTGKTMIQTQVDMVIPNLLLARILLQDHISDKDFSDYWTLTSYYNSLKSVGKINNKVGDEIYNNLRQLHNRLKLLSRSYNFAGLTNRTKELTSRIESAKIKATLKELEGDFALSEEGKYVQDTIDLVLASNMFSVGIDIGRLNVMLMNGQPKNIAEYIQASSRVARKREGLVINLLDGNLAREKSYFENYVPFHQAYYRFVEPLTVTPFTEITFKKVLNSILITYVRHIRGLNKNLEATQFDGNIEELQKLFHQRLPNEETLQKYAVELLEHLAQDWADKASLRRQEKSTMAYKNDLINDDSQASENDWAIMKSMREVDSTSLIAINVKLNQITDYANTSIEQA